MISLRQIDPLSPSTRKGRSPRPRCAKRATQSGMSHHVGQLEGELGTALFERSGRAVTPTRAGEIYYDECIAVLQRLECGPPARRRPAPQRRDPGRADAELHARPVLPPVLDKFLAAAPAAQISITEAYSGVLTEMVQRGELDFAGVPAFAGADGIVHRPLLRDRETLVRARRRGRKTQDALTSVRLSELGPLKVVAAGSAKHPPRQYRDLLSRPTASRWRSGSNSTR